MQPLCIVVVPHSDGARALNLNVCLFKSLLVLQVECPCGEINSRSFLSKKERQKFDCESLRVKTEAAKSRLKDSSGRSTNADTGVKPSAFAKVLRQFDPKIADEYEKIQETDRQTHAPPRVPHAALPDGTRVALDYAEPPKMQPNMKLDGEAFELLDSGRAGHGYGTKCLISKEMRDELLKRNLANIDPPGMQHSYRFIAARMCPRCFKGPLIEDEVNYACRFICS